MGFLDYEIDLSGNKRLVLLRAIMEDSKSRQDGAVIYIVPMVYADSFKVPLEVLRDVLTYLEDREHITIDERPNYKLSAEQRERRDDEEDYYAISLHASFYDFYDKAEEIAPFLNANADIISQPPHKPILASLRMEGYSPVVEAKNRIMKLPPMRTGRPLSIVTYGLTQSGKLLSRSQLKAKSIHGVNNVKEILRQSLFGETKPLGCFVTTNVETVIIYSETYISEEQFNKIEAASVPVS